MSDSIEPPKLITNLREELETIMEVANAIAEAKATKGSTTPIVAMLYLKFNSEADADHWNVKFKKILDYCWTEKMNQSSPRPLAYRFIARDNDRALQDVIVTESEESADLLMKMRFPEANFVPLAK